MKKDNISDMIETTYRRANAMVRPLFILMFLIFVSSFHAFALTAEEVAKKTAAVVSASKGVSASFTITSNGRSAKGTVKTSGSKFAVSTPQVSTWYNGKSLYTYNPRTNETTVTTPTRQELMESNPLLYVNAGTGFRYTFNPVKRNGKYVVDITPVKKNSGITKLTVTVNSTTFYPEKISVTAGGSTTTVDVTSFKTTTGGTPAEFEYPKSRYPKAEIVDLR